MIENLCCLFLDWPEFWFLICGINPEKTLSSSTLHRKNIYNIWIFFQNILNTKVLFFILEVHDIHNAAWHYHKRKISGCPTIGWPQRFSSVITESPHYYPKYRRHTLFYLKITLLWFPTLSMTSSNPHKMDCLVFLNYIKKELSDVLRVWNYLLLVARANTLFEKKEYVKSWMLRPWLRLITAIFLSERARWGDIVGISH